MGHRGFLVPLAHAVPLRLEFPLGQHVVQLVVAFAGADDPDVVHDAAVLDLAVRRLDETEIVDPRVAGQGRDQPDVRALGSLDGTDSPVMGRVHVSHLESGTFPGQPSGTQSRQAALVRYLRERVGLVHELGELTAAEELLDRRHHGLGVDQVVRHGRGHLLVDGHLFLDRPLHAHQADAELVLQQLADAAHAAVAQMVNVVQVAEALLEPEHVAQHLDEILARRGAVLALVPALANLGRPLVLRQAIELRVELEPPDLGEVVPRGIEEHVVEQRARGLHGGRIAGPQAPIDLDQRLVLVVDGVFGEGLEQRVANALAFGEHDLEVPDAPSDQVGEQLVGQL